MHLLRRRPLVLAKRVFGKVKTRRPVIFLETCIDILKTKETLQPIGRFEVARVGLFGEAVSSLIVFCVVLPKRETKFPPPPPAKRSYSLKMTHAFSRSVFHVVSRNAQCSLASHVGMGRDEKRAPLKTPAWEAKCSSKKNHVLLLSRIDAKKCNNLYRFRRKITGATSLRNFTKSRKTFQEKLSTEAGP